MFAYPKQAQNQSTFHYFLGVTSFTFSNETKHTKNRNTVWSKKEDLYFDWACCARRQRHVRFRNTSCSLNNRVAVTVSGATNNFLMASNWIPHSPGRSTGPGPTVATFLDAIGTQCEIIQVHSVTLYLQTRTGLSPNESHVPDRLPSSRTNKHCAMTVKCPL